jgi:hypothetical protein
VHAFVCGDGVVMVVVVVAGRRRRQGKRGRYASKVQLQS